MTAMSRGIITLVLVGCAAAIGIGAAVANRRDLTGNAQDSRQLASSDSKRLPPGPFPCPQGVAGGLVRAQTGQSGIIQQPAQLLTPAARAMLGDPVRFVGRRAATGGLPVEYGGQVVGKTSCNATLDDHPEAAQLALKGAAALAQQGFPIRGDGTRVPGEAEFLLRSEAFTSGVAYIMYVVGDLTSVGPTPIAGLPVINRNLCAVAAIRMDGTVLHASPIDCA